MHLKYPGYGFQINGLGSRLWYTGCACARVCRCNCQTRSLLLTLLRARVAPRSQVLTSWCQSRRVVSINITGWCKQLECGGHHPARVMAVNQSDRHDNAHATSKASSVFWNAIDKQYIYQGLEFTYFLIKKKRKGFFVYVFILKVLDQYFPLYFFNPLKQSKC